MEHSFFHYIKIFLIILFLYHDYTKIDDRESKVCFFLNKTSENISPHYDDYTNTKEISCENQDL